MNAEGTAETEMGIAVVEVIGGAQDHLGIAARDLRDENSR